MIMRYLVLIAIASCSFANKPQPPDPTVNCCRDIPVPKGYSLFTGGDSSFSNYLLSIKFKDTNTVLLFNGDLKSNQNAHYRVLNLGVGKRDLQQCADAVMRLRAEYLYHKGLFSRIKFHFTSGDLCKWTDYAKGFRPVINGNNVTFTKSASEDHSKKNFNSYLDLIFSYCGTASLHKELNSRNIKDIQPGDVLIQTGNPYGHAVMVMAVTKNKEGKRMFTIAQSYMPAQEIHVLLNKNDKAISPWYEAKEGVIETPEWTFQSSDLRTWQDN